MNIYIANKDELDLIFALRHEVFVKEQNVPEEIELDEHDTSALHIIAKEHGEVIGCARIIITENNAHIGRLAVKKDRRGQGVGSEICRFIIGYCIKDNIKLIWLNSQLHAVEFYEKLGFKKRGKIFTEAGIKHVCMVKIC